MAALLALELKADLLVLLSDVDGLYSGPPSDPHSKLIHTYVKERHQGEITFGDKSRVGRGGMTAKVKAATGAAYAGIPVVITRYASFLSASGSPSPFPISNNNCFMGCSKILLIFHSPSQPFLLVPFFIIVTIEQKLL